MTREDIEKLSGIVDALLDESVMTDIRENLGKRLNEVCELAIKALEQEPCEDAVSRQTVKEQMIKYGFHATDMTVTEFVVDELTPDTPQPKTGHWTPVSKRLPSHDEYIKNNGLFIVSDGNRSYSEWYDIYDKQMFGEPTISGFRVDYAVTAWMPLPEYYQEVEE